MEDKNWRVPATPAPPSGTQATRRETSGDYDGRQGLAISRNPQHHAAPKLQEGETREDINGRQELSSSCDPRHHHPAPKLQEGRHEEMKMGDNPYTSEKLKFLAASSRIELPIPRSSFWKLEK